MELRGRTRSYDKRLIRLPVDPPQHIPSAPESTDDDDDDDDDDIPAQKLPRTSPSKPLTLSASRPPTNGTKRPLSDTTWGGIVLYPGSKKPRNGYNMAPVPRTSPPGSTPESLSGPIPNHSPTGSVNSEYAVREGLVRSMNDALRRRQGKRSQDDEEQQRGVEPAPIADTLLDNAESEALEDVGSDMNKHDSESLLDIPHLELNALPLESGVPNGVDEAETPVAALENGEEQAGLEASTQAGTAVQQPDSVWEIPGSPGPQEDPEPTSYTNQTQQPTRKRGRPRKHYPRLHGETDNDYNTRIARLRKKPIPNRLDHDTGKLPQPLPVLEDTAHQAGPEIDPHLKCEPDNHPTWAISRAETSTRDGHLDGMNPALGCEENTIPNDLTKDINDDVRGSDAGETSETLSDCIEGFDSDPGTCDDMNHLPQESFDYDVRNFRARQRSAPEETDAFDGPMDDDVLAIHLDYKPLKQLCEVLGNEAWAGVNRGWQWRSFDYEHAETKTARTLLPLLAKLERLYQAAPSAPKLKEQNQFLREHADMLRYYFYKIKIVVEHIRTTRLEVSHKTIDSCKRKRMIRDLVAYILPLLAHVLASAWKLGGKTWTKPSFTGTAVEILKRIMGWIMILYPRLLGDLERSPFEGQTEDQFEQDLWLKMQDQRKRVGLVLEDLFEVFSTAPDQLAKMEAKEAADRQERLEKEEQDKIKQKAAEEARRAIAAERKQQSLLSIRAMRQHRDSLTTSSRPSPPPTLESPEWSLEERRLLFLRIQASFPNCPDLNELRWELNKTIAQTVAMTEQILERILKKVLIGYSAEERAAELRRIMQSSDAIQV